MTEVMKFTGVSEQGRTGLLWTIFEGEPFVGRRVASFVNREEALEYLKFKNSDIDFQI